MVDITQLWSTSERLIVDVTTLQIDVQWIHQHCSDGVEGSETD